MNIFKALYLGYFQEKSTNIRCLQDVSKKDFPCGDLKEEKGIQVSICLFVW